LNYFDPYIQDYYILKFNFEISTNGIFTDGLYHENDLIGSVYNLYNLRVIILVPHLSSYGMASGN